MTVIRRTFAPAAVGSSETLALYRPGPGTLVREVATRVVTSAAAATTGTFDVGDSADADGYVAAVSAVGTVGTQTLGAGAYRPGGRLYSARDTISLTYTPGAGAGAVVPRVGIAIWTDTIWPVVT